MLTHYEIHFKSLCVFKMILPSLLHLEIRTIFIQKIYSIFTKVLVFLKPLQNVFLVTPNMVHPKVKILFFYFVS